MGYSPQESQRLSNQHLHFHKLALAKSIASDWTTRACAIWLCGRVNPVLLQLLTFNTPWGSSGRSEALRAPENLVEQVFRYLAIFRNWFQDSNPCISSYLDEFLMTNRKSFVKRVLNSTELLLPFMKVKEESEKAGLNSTFKKLRSWHLVSSVYGKQKGKKWKQWQILFSWAPKSLWTVTAAMKLKDPCSLERKAVTNLDSILNSRNITWPTKVHIVKDNIFFQ